MALDPSIAEQQLWKRRSSAAARRCARASGEPRRVLGGGFALACLLLALAAPPWEAHDRRRRVVLSCALALAVAGRVHFSVGPGYTVPTQLALRPARVRAPPGAAGAAARAWSSRCAQLPDVARGRLPLSRLALTPANSWFAIGPAAVLAGAGVARRRRRGALGRCGDGRRADRARRRRCRRCATRSTTSSTSARCSATAWLYAVDVALDARSACSPRWRCRRAPVGRARPAAARRRPRRLRARARGAAAEPRRAQRRLPRHGARARRRRRGRRRLHRASTAATSSTWPSRSAAHSGSRPSGCATSSSARCCTTWARSPIPKDDHQQAGPARRG